MKRDMMLIRTLLEHVENSCEGNPIMPPCLPGYTDKQIHYHVSLCQQAEFLDTTKISPGEAPYPRYAMHQLTWHGHEMLDKLRS